MSPLICPSFLNSGFSSGSSSWFISTFSVISSPSIVSSILACYISARGLLLCVSSANTVLTSVRGSSLGGLSPHSKMLWNFSRNVGSVCILGLDLFTSGKIISCFVVLALVIVRRLSTLWSAFFITTCCLSLVLLVLVSIFFGPSVPLRWSCHRNRLSLFPMLRSPRGPDFAIISRRKTFCSRPNNSL